MRWHQGGIWIRQVCKGIIQERQESFSWGNPTEWQPTDTRPGSSWNIQVPGNGGGWRGTIPQKESQDQEGVKRRIKLVLKSELNARNKKAAINTLAVPVIHYSYVVIDWKLDEIQDLDRMTRKQLCMNQMLAKKADVDRIYLSFQEGWRSLMNLEKEYKATMIGLQTYMINKDDVQIQVVLRHQNSKPLHSVPKEAEKYLTEVCLRNTRPP